MVPTGSAGRSRDKLRRSLGEAEEIEAAAAWLDVRVFVLVVLTVFYRTVLLFWPVFLSSLRHVAPATTAEVTSTLEARTGVLGCGDINAAVAAARGDG